MAASETCSVCGEGVRWGWRNGREAYWHRLEVDHHPKFGALIYRPWDRPEDKVVVEKVVEPVEVWCMPTDITGKRIFVGFTDGPPAINQIPGGAKTIVKMAKGWTVKRATYARGPYLGANGDSLGVSDTFALIVEGWVDGSLRQAVASWRDGKFDWSWTIVDHRLHERANSKSLRSFVKGEPLCPSSPSATTPSSPPQSSETLPEL